MDKDLIDNFIMHPDWRRMEAYIIKHFEKETDITDIDITLDSTVIHAEVIARQRIGKDIKSLIDSFETVKRKKDKTKINYE